MVNRVFVDQRTHPHADFFFDRPIWCAPCTATSGSPSFQRRRILDFGPQDGILWYRRLECRSCRETISCQTNDNRTSLHDHFPSVINFDMALFRVLQNGWKAWHRLLLFPCSDTPNGHGNKRLDCQLQSSETSNFKLSDIDLPYEKLGSWWHLSGSPLTQCRRQIAGIHCLHKMG